MSTDYAGVAVGAVADPEATYCRHAEVFTLPTDPGAELLTTCERPAPARVPRPETDAPVALCAYHLARYRDAYPEVWADLEADYGCNEFVPEHAVTSLDDAPADYEHNGRYWRRVALDQQGHVHYASRDDGLSPAMLELGEEFAVVDVTPVDPRSQDAYFDAVTRRVGWAEIADWVRSPDGGET